MVLGAGHEADVRTAEAERDAERLTVSDGYVRSPLRRSLKDGEGGRVAVLDEEGLALVESLREAGQVLDDAETVDARDDGSGDIAALHRPAKGFERCLSVLGPDHNYVGAKILGIGLDRLDDIGKKGA